MSSPFALPLKRLGYLFYVVSPEDTSFESVDDVPDYIAEVVPYFVVFIALEFALSVWIKKSDSFQLDDSIASLSQGLLQEAFRLFFESAQTVCYVYIYEHLGIGCLPWDSIWTWLFAFVATDFGYYWAHRCSHEVNILWAAHQVHHSSEFYNLTTALRQSVIQDYFVPVFYLPLAFIMPPSAYVVHRQLNILFQFWIHTEAIHELGPLEYIFNTPSHHRVHHGRNRYCIDKNYAGTLIIWDRLFGTFEAEAARPAYGLTTPINTFNPWTIQMCHFQYMWTQIRNANGLGHILSIIFKGPGWARGKPRLGDLNEIPDIKGPVERYAGSASTSWKAYATIHFILLLVGYMYIVQRKAEMMTLTMALAAAYSVFSVYTIAALLGSSPLSYHLEAWRCILFLLVQHYLQPSDDMVQVWFCIKAVFVISLACTLTAVYTVTSHRPHCTAVQKDG